MDITILNSFYSFLLRNIWKQKRNKQHQSLGNQPEVQKDGRHTVISKY